MQKGSTMIKVDERERAWARVRASLRESAGHRLFEQWLKPMEMVGESDPDTVRLALPTPFATNWVRNHYADRLLLEFRAQLPQVRAVSIETRASTANVVTLLTPEPANSNIPDSTARSAAPSPTSAPKVESAERPALDARFTFDRFVVDQSNRVAFNAARALAVADFAYVLRAGTVQRSGHAASLASRADVVEAYLGEH